MPHFSSILGFYDIFWGFFLTLDNKIIVFLKKGDSYLLLKITNGKKWCKNNVKGTDRGSNFVCCLPLIFRVKMLKRNYFKYKCTEKKSF